MRLSVHRIFLACVLPLLLHSAVFARERGDIIGQVFDVRTREPLIGVNVVVMGSNTGASTDDKGRFRITGLPVGSYRLKAMYIGYEPVVVTDVEVMSGRPATVSIALKESYVTADTVFVRPDYFVEEIETSASSTLLSREEIRRFPGGFEDVVRTVATLPGVAVVNEGGRNDLLVRGGGPSENLYLVNGIEAPNINHFGTQGASSGALSFINLDFIDRVEFSSGGFSARYGNKLSSVLAIDLRSGRSDRLGGKATVSATQFGLNVEGPIAESGSFLFSARQSYLDLIFKAAGQPFVPVYTDFNLLAEAALSDKDRLSLLTLVALDRVDRDLSSRENRIRNASLLDNTQNQLIAGLKYRRLFRFGYVDAIANVNFNGFRLSQEDEFGDSYFRSDADEIRTQLKLNTFMEAGKSAGLSAGLSVKHIINRNTTAFADTVYDRSGNRIPVSNFELPQNLSSNMASKQFAGFVEWEQDWARGWRTALGLRADHYGYIDNAFYVSARATTWLDLSGKLSMRASLGRYYQPPALVWTTNQINTRLRALRSDMSVFGLSYLLREDANLTLEFYHKRYADLPTGVVAGETDYLVLTNTGVGFGGREDDFQSFGYIDLISHGSGRATGVELAVQKKYSEVPLYGKASLAVSKSTVTANDGVTYPGQFDQRLIFNVSAGYKFNSKWQLGGKFRLFSGAPFTPVYRPSQNGGHIQNLPQEYLSQRLSAGHTLDLRLDRRFNFRAWNLIVFLDIQNIYNYKIQVRPSYDFWEDEVEDTNTIGILPSLGISAEF